MSKAPSRHGSHSYVGEYEDRQEHRTDEDPLTSARRIPTMSTRVMITTTTIVHRVAFRITALDTGWHADFGSRREALAFCDQNGWKIASAVTTDPEATVMAFSGASPPRRGAR